MEDTEVKRGDKTFDESDGSNSFNDFPAAN
jgi:hypothetical protein